MKRYILRELLVRVSLLGQEFNKITNLARCELVHISRAIESFYWSYLKVPGACAITKFIIGNIPMKFDSFQCK